MIGEINFKLFAQNFELECVLTIKIKPTVIQDLDFGTVLPR